MWCATTSCNSCAMRIRSSATARLACSASRSNRRDQRPVLRPETKGGKAPHGWAGEQGQLADVAGGHEEDHVHREKPDTQRDQSRSEWPQQCDREQSDQQADTVAGQFGIAEQQTTGHGPAHHDRGQQRGALAHCDRRERESGKQ